MKTVLQIALIFTVAAVTTESPAYWSVMSTGDIVPKNRLEVGSELQLLTSNDSGVNVVGRLDGGLFEDANYRLELGLGTTKLHGAAYYKWIPFPDAGDQPALGFLAGVTFGEFLDDSQIGLRFAPLASKKLVGSLGDLNVYGSLPFGLVKISGSTFTPLQLVLGTEYETKHFDHIRFLGEVGFDLNDAFSYISVGARFILDEDHRFQLERN